MNENLFEGRYDITKKSKLEKFYTENKILIISTFIILLIVIGSYSFYSYSLEKKKNYISENYISARIYLENGNKNEARNILKTIILENDSTYSTLSLFLILNENLIDNQDEISNLFDHVIKNNKFEKEIKNLIIFKKAIFLSDYASETELLKITNELINTESIWKAHALLLLGDYFVSKKEFLKGKDYYKEVLLMKNISKDFYEHARQQIMLISNE